VDRAVRGDRTRIRDPHCATPRDREIDATEPRRRVMLRGLAAIRGELVMPSGIEVLGLADLAG